MSRPHLTLEKWLSNETDLKKAFLDQEILLRPNEISRRVKPGEKVYFFSTNSPHTSHNENLARHTQYNQSHAANTNQLILNTLRFENENFVCEINNEQFKILKNRFRSFKHKYINKKEHRVTKQIILNQKTFKELERLTEKYNLKSLQNCLDFLTDTHNFKLNEKDKIISGLKSQLNANHDSILRQELKLKDEEIKELKDKLVHQKNAIQENMNQSAKVFEEFLFQKITNLTIELEKFKAFLGDISEGDASAINKALESDVLDQIKTECRKDLEAKRMSIILQKQSYTNESLGFDQHKNYPNPEQNDEENQSEP